MDDIKNLEKRGSFLKRLNMLLIFSIFIWGCSFTAQSPIEPLKKAESKHSIFFPFPSGYQYQRGITDELEVGVSLKAFHKLEFEFAPNLRYHLSRHESHSNSIQLEHGFGGSRFPINGSKVSLMHTRKIGSESSIRLGPNLSYQTESRGEYLHPLYTTRLGVSFTLGLGHEKSWLTLGYNIPISKNYNSTKLGSYDAYSDPVFLFGFDTPRYRTGDKKYNLELTLGYGF